MLSKDTGILVVMGGWSAEREVSLASGNAVLDCLLHAGYRAKGHDLAPSEDHFRAVEGLLTDIKESRAAVVYIALHGPFGEDGTLQGLLEMAGVPYTGSGVLASALAMDKAVAKQVFVSSRLTTPKYAVLERSAPPLTSPLPLPVVVKPRALGSSIGVSLVEKHDDFGPALEEAFKYDAGALVEAYVKGRELQGGVLDGAPLPLIEITTSRTFYDYEAKYIQGKSEHKVPAPVPKKQYDAAQQVAVAAYRALGCAGAARVEMIAENTGTLYLIEVNTLPGMTPTSLLPEAARESGMSFLELVIRQLEGAMNRQASSAKEKE